jgi:prepilin-type N-terminal cleavage/methylation domain-containing protein
VNQKSNNTLGFTLIEIAVAIVVIGIFLGMIQSPMFGLTDAAKAKALQQVAQYSGQNWSTLCSQAGVTTQVSSSVIPAGSQTTMDVIFGGRSMVAAAYQSAFDAAKIKPLSDMVTASGSTWCAQGFAVTFGGGGTAAFTVSYANVTQEVALLMAQKYDSTVTSLTAAGGTVGLMTYGAVSAGKTTVTLTRYL